MGIRDFRRYAFGQTISVSGTWMQKLAQAWLVLVLTDSPFMLGLTMAMQQLPTLLFTNLGGLFADRWNRRTILIWTGVCGAVPPVVLCIVVQLDIVQIWMVMAAALFQGMAEAVEKPARLTIVNDLADTRRLTNAVMLNGIIQESGKVAGPAIAGVLIATIGVAAAFAVNAISFIPVIIALLLIRPRRRVQSRETFKARGNLTGTLRYVSLHPELSSALILMAVAGLLAYNWSVLVPVLAHDTFGGDARSVGLAFTAMGLGASIGGLAVAGYLKATGRRLMAYGGVFALSMLLVSASPSLVVGYGALFVLGAVSVAFRAVATSLIQLRASETMRGRVTSLLVLATAGTTPLAGRS